MLPMWMADAAMTVLGISAAIFTYIFAKEALTSREYYEILKAKYEPQPQKLVIDDTYLPAGSKAILKRSELCRKY